MSKKILIVGGGNAGISVAAQLLRKCPDVDLTIVEPSSKHYYQPAWTLVGAGIYDVKKTERNEADFIPRHAKWVKERVSSFLPEHQKVVLENGEELSYDIMVVAAGIQLDWDKLKGLEENKGQHELSSNYDMETAPYTWQMIKDFKGGVAVFTNPNTPIKCGGAPHKIMYLAVDYWRKKGILDQCDVHYISGSSVLFGVPAYAKTLEEVVKKGNIKTHFSSNILHIDGKKKTIEFETSETHDRIKTKMSSVSVGCFSMQEPVAGSPTSKVILKYDLCHAVPPQSAPEFIKKSPLADPKNLYGYVEIDKHTMQHTRFPNIFALGDCTNAPCSKTGAAIRKQAPVVVQNILSLLKKEPLVATYNGYSACPIPTQYGKLMLAEFDYANIPTMTFPFDQTKPRWIMWILKTKILPWLYWNKILKGTA